MMLKEPGVIVKVEGDFAWVGTQPKSTCGHCNVADMCGTSVLAKWFSPRQNRVRVLNHLNLKPGEAAVVGVADSVLIKAAFIAYMLPLLSMISFAVMGSALWMNNLSVVASSLVGLLTGIWFVSFLNSRPGSKHYQAQLLR